MGLKLEKGGNVPAKSTTSRGTRDAGYNKLEVDISDEEASETEDGAVSDVPPPSLNKRSAGTRSSGREDHPAPTSSRPRNSLSYLDDDEVVEPEAEGLWCCKNRERVVGIKVDTIVRLLKVCLAFPFVIVVSSLNLSDQYSFLRSIAGVRVMNVLIYVAPVVYG